MTHKLSEGFRETVPDGWHEDVDTRAAGYDPLLTLTAKGDRLSVKAQFEMEVPLETGLNDPLALVDTILERLVLDMRVDGAAEIKDFLRANGRRIFPRVQGNA